MFRFNVQLIYWGIIYVADHPREGRRLQGKFAFHLFCAPKGGAKKALKCVACAENKSRE